MNDTAPQPNESSSKPELAAKDQPDLSGFSWEDPLMLETQLEEDERLFRDAVAAYASDKLAPRVKEAYREEKTDPGIFREMGEMGLLGITIPESYGGAGCRLCDLWVGGS